MSDSIEIRLANTTDIPVIGYLAQQIWPITYKDILSPEQMEYMMNLNYTPESLEKQLNEEGHQFLIIEQDEEPIGFASWGPTEPGIFKLHKIYLHPKTQGKGLGRAMIDFIEEDIRPKAATALRLNVNRYNKAKSFYEKLGFAVIAEGDFDIGNNYFMNDYIMEKKL